MKTIHMYQLTLILKKLQEISAEQNKTIADRETNMKAKAWVG